MTIQHVAANSARASDFKSTNKLWSLASIYVTMIPVSNCFFQ